MSITEAKKLKWGFSDPQCSNWETQEKFLCGICIIYYDNKRTILKGWTLTWQQWHCVYFVFTVYDTHVSKLPFTVWPCYYGPQNNNKHDMAAQLK